MNEHRTLYISDLDGTLLNSSAELSKYTTTTLNTMIANGLHFSVATARTFASAGIILSSVEFQVSVVLLNGVLIYDTMRKMFIQINRLTSETVAAVIQTLKTLEATGLMYELKDGEQMTYYETLEQKPLRDFVEERIARYYKSFSHADTFSSVSPENIVYFTLLDTYEKLLPVRDALAVIPDLSQTFYKDNYSPDLWYLEAFSDKASKRHAVDYLRETYGYERVVGFGDNLNDLPMFEACDIRVAVGNAKPEVKAAADYICGANDADGVVKWITERVLI